MKCNSASSPLYRRPRIGEQLRQQPPMAMAGVLAVAADGEVGRRGYGGEELDQVPRGGSRHLATIDPLVAPPARRGPGIAQCPRDDRSARRELGEPAVGEVSP